MFGWRRKTDPFEWRKYVRTTILVRRERRRQRLDDIKNAAVDGLKEAGRAGAAAGASGIDSASAGLSGAGSRVAVAAKGGLAWMKSRLAGVDVSRVLAPLRGLKLPSVPGAAPVLAALRQPGLSMPLAVIGVIAGLAAVGRWIAVGLDGEALVAGAIAIGVAAVMLVPRVMSDGFRGVVDAGAAAFARVAALIGITSVSPRVASLAGLGVIGMLVAGASILARHTLPGGSESGAVAVAPKTAAPAQRAAGVPTAVSGTLSGRASATSGATLSIAGREVRLMGIEAPERGQICPRSNNKRWRCGEAAARALQQLVRGKTIDCQVSAAGVGSCKSGELDLAGEMVRGGHVFAEDGFFARYASLEHEARASQSGIWGSEAERPSAYRSKLWEEAKRSAPEGCPIKAHVGPEGRIYLLPWSKDYAKAAVRSAKGERWFCSETDAKAAGWRPASGS